MSFGLEPGELIEIRVTPELIEALKRWIESDAQLPATTAGAFGNPLALSAALGARREGTERAVRQLGEVLRRHAVKAADAQVIEAGERFRLACDTREA